MQARPRCLKKEGLDHYYSSRWRKVFWWGEEPAQTEIHYDIDYIISTGLLPRYDLDVAVTADQKTRELSRWAGKDKDILEFGLITPYMPQTGGREDLAPNPNWLVRWLFSQEKWAAKIALTTSDLAGTFPIHYRDAATGRIVSIKDRPHASLNWSVMTPGRCTWDDCLRQPVGSISNPGTPDDSHQPNLSYIPYLLTGDYYYLEELYFWANWNILHKHWDYRMLDKGLYTGATRGVAWGLRTIADAAAIAPDADMEKAYFDDIVKFNIHYYDSVKVTHPEYECMGCFNAWELGSHVRPDPCMKDSVVYMISPWQDDFVTMIVDHIVDLGYDEAVPLRDYKLQYATGRFTNPGVFNPFDGAPYHLASVIKRGGEDVVVSDWKTVYDNSYTGDCGGGTSLNASHDYLHFAKAALSAHARSTASAKTGEAYDFLDTNLGADLDLNQSFGFIPGPGRTVVTTGIADRQRRDAGAAWSVSVFPHPVSGHAAVRCNTTGAAVTSAGLYSLAGERVTCLDAGPSGNRSLFYLNTGGLENGLYILRITRGTHVTEQHVSVINR